MTECYSGNERFWGILAMAYAHALRLVLIFGFVPGIVRAGEKPAKPAAEAMRSMPATSEIPKKSTRDFTASANTKMVVTLVANKRGA